MKRFVIIAQGSELSGITRFLKARKVGYWHHVSHAWLVYDPRDRSGAWWHGQLKKFVGEGSRMVIINAETAGYTAIGPKSMFPWLRRTWRRS